MQGVIGSALKVVENLTGLEAGKFAKAFGAEMTDVARLGEQAVKRSRADSAKNIINKAINADGFLDENLTKQARKALDGSRDDMFSFIKDNISGRDIKDETFKKAVKDYVDKTGSFEKAVKEGASAADINEFLGKEGEKLGFRTRMSGFFGDETYGAIRTNTGLYAGGAIGLRLLSGGNLTTNNRGERDIAGIPFI